ncbi:MAG: hypothetical protein FWD74_09680 [Actinomycetia bacterium]|nr:hypothetical protein [Actinomycetes bacterium]
MSLPSLSTGHLSDEAIAAYADGMLGATALSRASRHVQGCAECAQAIAIQREAAWALRLAPAPAPSMGLLDRLRAVPATVPLTGVFGGPVLAIGCDGAAEFASVDPSEQSLGRPAPGWGAPPI